jgi:predicted nucleic acid-binding Zn ribbon protein
MPKYSFKCGNCGLEEQKIVSYDKRNFITCSKCGTTMKFKPPIPADNIVNEMADSYRNKVIKKDII